MIDLQRLSKFAGEEELSLLKELTPEGTQAAKFFELQEDMMYKAMHFAIKNPARAARLLVMKGLMPMEDYLQARF